MVINIGEIEKVGITHALRIAMAYVNNSLRDEFDICHPDRYKLDWYRVIEDKIGVMKELKRLLDRIEEPGEEGTAS